MGPALGFAGTAVSEQALVPVSYKAGTSTLHTAGKACKRTLIAPNESSGWSLMTLPEMRCHNYTISSRAKVVMSFLEGDEWPHSSL